MCFWLAQAQPALRGLFELLPAAWALVAERRPAPGGRAAAAATEQDLLQLGDLSWLAPALLWGPAIGAAATSAAWAAALCQVRAVRHNTLICDEAYVLKTSQRTLMLACL